MKLATPFLRAITPSYSILKLRDIVLRCIMIEIDQAARTPSLGRRLQNISGKGRRTCVVNRKLTES